MAATIRDVAHRAGVSPSTVSRVLNNKGVISDETAQRIQKAMQELHYVPNDFARSFATGSAHTIAIVIDVENTEAYSNNFFNDTVFGIETTAHKNDYNLLITNGAEAFGGIDSVERLVLGKKIDGVIIPDAMKEEIFKPFVRFNEQEDGKVTTGTGIGLALSRSLAEFHLGTLVMEAGEESNIFCLTLPVVQDTTITLTPEAEVEIERVNEIPAEQAGKKDNRPAVLVVEDNPDMLTFVVRQLSRDYTVLTATNGAEALQVLDGNYVNLVISDVVMPSYLKVVLILFLQNLISYSYYLSFFYLFSFVLCSSEI